MMLFPTSSRAALPVPRGPSWRRGLARSVGIVRRPWGPDPPDPLTLDHRLGAVAALELLAVHGQAMAFVATDRGSTGVVSAEDLRFAADWAGTRATVGDAVTQALIDLTPDDIRPIPTLIEEP